MANGNNRGRGVIAPASCVLHRSAIWKAAVERHAEWPVYLRIQAD